MLHWKLSHITRIPHVSICRHTRSVLPTSCACRCPAWRYGWPWPPRPNAAAAWTAAMRADRACYAPHPRGQREPSSAPLSCPRGPLLLRVQLALGAERCCENKTSSALIFLFSAWKVRCLRSCARKADSSAALTATSLCCRATAAACPPGHPTSSAAGRS